MNPVTSGAGEMMSAAALISTSAMLNATGKASAPMQHEPQLLHEACF